MCKGRVRWCVHACVCAARGEGSSGMTKVAKSVVRAVVNGARATRASLTVLLVIIDMRLESSALIAITIRGRLVAASYLYDQVVLSIVATLKLWWDGWGRWCWCGVGGNGGVETRWV